MMNLKECHGQTLDIYETSGTMMAYGSCVTMKESGSFGCTLVAKALKPASEVVAASSVDDGVTSDLQMSPTKPENTTTPSPAAGCSRRKPEHAAGFGYRSKCGPHLGNEMEQFLKQICSSG